MTSKTMVAIIHTQESSRLEHVELTEDQPVNLGRAWTNDIIFEDSYVDPDHCSLVLKESGHLSIEDHGSTNGTRLNKKLVVQQRLYEEGDTLFLGESSVRFYDVESAVQDAKPIDLAQKFTTVFSGPIVALSVTFAAMLTLVLHSLLMEETETTVEGISQSLAGFLSSGLVWSLLLGIVGKLFRKRSNVSQQWLIFCLFLIVSNIYMWVSHIINFNIDSLTPSPFVNIIYPVAAICLFGYLTLSLSTRMQPVFKGLIVGLIACIPIIVVVLGRPPFKSEAELWTQYGAREQVTMSPRWLFRSPVGLAEHMANVDALFAGLEAEVADD